MDHAEEQKAEGEALESIYADEYTKIDDKTLEIKLCPNPGEGPENNYVALTLRVVYSPNYPETRPECSLQPTKGLPKRVMPELEALVEKAIQDGLGEPVVFSVATALQEWMQDHNQPELTAHEAMMQRHGGDKPVRGSSDEEEMSDGLNRAQLEAEEMQRRNKYVSPLGIEPGTMVTEESFENWRLRFAEEQLTKKMEAKNKKEKMEEAGKAPKKTGKQLFLDNAALGLGLEDGKKEEGQGEGADVYWFNEELYGDIDDEDLDALALDEGDGEAAKPNTQQTEGEKPKKTSKTSTEEGKKEKASAGGKAGTKEGEGKKEGKAKKKKEGKKKEKGKKTKEKG